MSRSPRFAVERSTYITAKLGEMVLDMTDVRLCLWSRDRF